MRQYLFLLLLFQPIFVFAQLPPISQQAQRSEWVYPIKVKHKWGFIDATGDVVVEPKYDAIGDQYLLWPGTGQRSPFRLVEINGKLGLIDTRLNEVLAPAYKRILPLSNNLFAVVSDSLFTVVNRLGEFVVGGSFEEVSLFSGSHQDLGRFFKIKNGERWGVCANTGEVVLPPVYFDVDWLEVDEDFFKVKKTEDNELYGLMNSKGKEVLPSKYLNIRAIHANFFAFQSPINMRWEACDSTREKILGQHWLDIFPLNKAIIGLRDGNNTPKLYSLSKMDTVTFRKIYEDILPLDESYVIWKKGNDVGMLDTFGRELNLPAFRKISPGFDTLYRGVQFKWGLFSINKGIVLPCSYDSVGTMVKDILMVKKEGLYGIINKEFKEVIPPFFDRMEVSDSIVKGYDGSALSIFLVDEKGEVALLHEGANVRTIRVGYRSNRNYIEAKPMPNRSRRVVGLEDDVQIPFTAIDSTAWIWRRDPNSLLFGLWGQRAQGGLEQVAPNNFKEVLHLNTARLTLAFDASQRVVNGFGKVAALPVDTLYKMALFSHQQGKFVTPFNMLGLRGFDFRAGRRYAVFIDLDGQMGLIDRQGNQANGKNGKPLRFTYIGDFYEGKARVCVGGRLAIAEEVKAEKYGVLKVVPFVKLFGITTSTAWRDLENKTIIVDSLDGKAPVWGYIDSLGNIVIEPRFAFANDFDRTLAINQLGSGWGVINDHNEAVLPFKYSTVSRFYDRWRVGIKNESVVFFNQKGHEIISSNYRRQGKFSEGLCRVMNDSLWGYIDEDGKEIIACQFEVARDFSEGISAVKKGGEWGFIDTSGQYIFDIKTKVGGEVSTIGDFQEGVAFFKTGFKYGFINPKGEVKITPQFSKAFDFQYGVARAVWKAKTGFVDTLGGWILKPERFERIGEFDKNGLAPAWEKSGQKCCLVRSDGQVLTPLKYTQIGTFKEGLAPVHDGKYWGMIDLTGKEVFALQYEKVGEMSEGLVAVRPRFSYTWYYADRQGNRALKGNFEKAEPFSRGLAVVHINLFDPLSKVVVDRNGRQLAFGEKDLFQFYSEGIFGFWRKDGELEGGRMLNLFYADAQGRNLYGRMFQDIKPFSGGLGLVKKDHRWGAMNPFGLFVIPPKYPFVNQMDDGSISVRLPVLFGVVDNQGGTLLPNGFDRIDLMAGDIYRLELGEKVGYARLDGEWIWELQK